MTKRPPDPIIAELWAVRDAYTARFDHDVSAMFRDLRARQEASGREHISLPPRPPRQTAGDGNERVLPRED